MTEGDRPADAGPQAHLGQLVERIDSMGRELVELRRALGEEVRTRRVVVVEDDGFERIVLGAAARFGHVTVQARSAGGEPACVELFANDRINGGGAHVGVALSDAGDVAAVLELIVGRLPELWIGPATPRAGPRRP